MYTTLTQHSTQEYTRNKQCVLGVCYVRDSRPLIIQAGLDEIFFHVLQAGFISSLATPNTHLYMAITQNKH